MLPLSAALSLMLAAAPAEAWTLERVVREAVTRSPEVAAAWAEELAAKDVRAADGRWLRDNPQLEVLGATDALTAGDGEQRLEVGLSQTVEVAGQRGLRVARAESALDAAKARRQATMLAVAAAVVDAAVELERLEARARLAEEALGLARALEEAATRRFAAGDVAEVERNAAALERARAEARAAQARAEVQGARAALNPRLGRPIAAPLTVTDLAVASPRASSPEPRTEAPMTPGAGVPEPRTTATVTPGGQGPRAPSSQVREVEGGRPEPREAARADGDRPELRDAARATLPSPLVRERPDLQAARAEEEAAQAEVRLLQRERFPDLTVGIGYERERMPEDHGAVTDLHTGHLLIARLSVPLPLWDRNQRELAEARARRGAREAERVGRERQVESDAVMAQSAYEAARAAQAALGAALPLVERNLELVRRAYEAGELGLDALLLARDRAFAARAEAVDAAAGLLRARTAVLRADGRLPTGGVPQ